METLPISRPRLRAWPAAALWFVAALLPGGCAESPVPSYNLGVEAYERGDLAEAIRQWEIAIALHPENYDALVNLGIAYLDSDLHDESLRYLERAESLRSDDPLLFFTRGECYLAMRAPLRSIEPFEHAIRLDPAWAPPRAGLGEAYYRLGDLDAAGRLGQEAVDLHYGLAAGHDLLGRVMLRRGDVAGAESEFRAALELEPEDGSALVGMASVLAARRDYIDAIKLYLEGARKGGPFAEAHAGIGDCYTILGDLPEAMTHYGHALGRDPRHVPSLLGYGKVRLLRGEPAEAEGHLRRAHELESADGGWPELEWEISFRLGTALAALGRGDEALPLLEAARADPSHTPLVELTLGETYLQTGRTDEARALLEGFLRTWNGDRKYTERARLALSRITPVD